MVGLVAAQILHHQIERIGEKMLAPVAVPVHIAGDALGSQFADGEVRERSQVNIGYMRELEHGATLKDAARREQEE
ncbi:hypothetical protein D3C72_2010830 [compost metagenome]